MKNCGINNVKALPTILISPIHNEFKKDGTLRLITIPNFSLAKGRTPTHPAD